MLKKIFILAAGSAMGMAVCGYSLAEDLKSDSPGDGRQQEILQALDRFENIAVPAEPWDVPAEEEAASSPPLPRTSVILESLEVSAMDAADVLKLLSLKSGVRMTAEKDVKGLVTIYLRNVDVWDALRIIVEMNGWAYVYSASRDKRQNGNVLVMTADQYEIKYGYPFADETKTKMISLTHIKTGDIAGTLNQIKSPGGRVIANDIVNTLFLIDTSDKLRAMEAVIKEIDVPLETKKIEFKYTTLEKIRPQLTEAISREFGRLEQGASPNVAILTDRPSKIKEIEALISQLDKQEKEILFEAKAIQVVLNMEHDDGIDWEAIVSNFQRAEPLPWGSPVSVPETPDSAQQKSYAALSLGIVSGEDYATLLDALDTVGIVRTVFDGKMTTPDKTEAYMDIKIPDPSDTDVSMSGDKIRLFLTPIIQDDEGIRISFKTQINFFNRSPNAQDVSTETMDAGAAPEDTEDLFMQTKTGEVIVAGSLFKGVMVESLRKIPLLGDLPFVGFAFRNQRAHMQMTEIILFVTPRIVVKNNF